MIATSSSSARVWPNTLVYKIAINKTLRLTTGRNFVRASKNTDGDAQADNLSSQIV